MNEEGEIFTVDSSKIQSALDSYASNLPACPFYKENKCTSKKEKSLDDFLV